MGHFQYLENYTKCFGTLYAELVIFLFLLSDAIAIFWLLFVIHIYAVLFLEFGIRGIQISHSPPTKKTEKSRFFSLFLRQKYGFDPIFDPTHDFFSIELCFYLLHEAVHSLRALLFHLLRYMTVHIQRE